MGVGASDANDPELPNSVRVGRLRASANLEGF